MVPSILIFKDLYYLYEGWFSTFTWKHQHHYHSHKFTGAIHCTFPCLSLGPFFIISWTSCKSSWIHIGPQKRPESKHLKIQKRHFSWSFSNKRQNSRFFQTTTSFFQPKNPQVIIPTPGPPVDNIWKEWVAGVENAVVSFFRFVKVLVIVKMPLLVFTISPFLADLWPVRSKERDDYIPYKIMGNGQNKQLDEGWALVAGDFCMQQGLWPSLSSFYIILPSTSTLKKTVWSAAHLTPPTRRWVDHRGFRSPWTSSNLDLSEIKLNHIRVSLAEFAKSDIKLHLVTFLSLLLGGGAYQDILLCSCILILCISIYIFYRSILNM